MSEQQQTILIIDGSPTDRAMIRRCLGRAAPHAYEVIEATSGDEGLRMWRERRPYCVLLDARPPGADGLELLAARRRDADDTPVIMLLNRPDASLADAARERGAHDSLIKERIRGGDLARVVANVIERAQIEASLRATEDRFRRAADAAGALIYDLDLQGLRPAIVYGLERMLGSDAALTPFSDEWRRAHIHPDDLPGYLDRLDHCLQSGAICHMAYRIRRSDGAWIDVEDSAEVVRDAAGQPVRMVGTIVDATQRKAAEQALRTSEERLRVAVEAGAIGVWDIDLRTGARNWSEQGKAIYGLAPHDHLDYERQIALVHPDDRAYVHDLVTQFRDLGEIKRLDFQHRILRPDGAVRWVAVRGEAIYDGGPLPVRLIGTLLDITERVEAEADERLLADLFERIQSIDDEGELLWMAQQAIGEYLQASRCFFTEVDLGRNRGIVRRDYCRDVPSVAGEYRVSDYSPITRAELEAGRTLINHDAQTDPRTAAYYAQTYAPAGERAYVGAPLLRDGRWIATLSVTVDRPRRWQPREITLLETIAERVWLAVEKRRLDATLRASDERLRLAAQVAGFGMFDFNPQTGAQYWSDVSRAIYELSDDDPLTFAQLAERVHLGDRERIQAAIAACLDPRGAGEIDQELRIVRADGQTRWLHIKGRTFFAGQGAARRATRTTGTTFDITERMRAATTSALLAAVSSALADAGYDEAAILDSVAGLFVPAFADWFLVHRTADDGPISYDPLACADPANAALLRALQATYPSDPAWAHTPIARAIQAQQALLIADPPADWPERVADDPRHQRAFRSLAPRSLLVAPLGIRGRRFGALTWAVAESGRRYDDADLDLAQELARRVTLALDNARLYAAERQARAAAERTAERIAALQALTSAFAEAPTSAQIAEMVVQHGVAAIEAGSGLLALMTADGEALEIVDSAGYDPAKIAAWRRLPLDAQAPLAEAVRERAMTLIESPQEWERYPVLIQSEPGKPGHSIAVVPLTIDARVVGAIGLSFADFRCFSAEDRVFLRSMAQQTAQALARAQLYEAERQAHAAADEAVAVRDQFLSVAAHELRNPLTALIGATQLLERRAARAGTLAERDLNAVRTITEQGRRLNTMITTLLDVSRLEMDQLDIARSALDLDALLRRIIDEHRPMLNGHTLAYHAPGAPLVVEGDTLRLEQVFQNLLGNAIKYSPGGGPVTVRAERCGAMACVHISDEGIGIPAEALPKLFGRFYRVNGTATQDISGTGIGLYVVKELVSLHGGEVRVASMEGEGSTFTVRLPLQAPAP